MASPQVPAPNPALGPDASLQSQVYVHQLCADIIQSVMHAGPEERKYLVRAIQRLGCDVASEIEPRKRSHNSLVLSTANGELARHNPNPSQEMPPQDPSLDTTDSHSDVVSSSRRHEDADNNRKRKRSRRSSSATPDPSVELFPVKFALSATAGIKDVSLSRDAFFQELCALKLKVKTDNKTSTGSFSTGEATAITNFFFFDVMGPTARQRLTLLLNYYSCHNDESIDVGASARADQLAAEPGTIPVLRDFYASFSQAHRQKLSSNTNYAYFVQTIASLKLYQEWTSLRDLAASKDPALLATLKASGLKASRGVDYRSLVNQFLTAKLGLQSTGHLQNMCQSAQVIAMLVQQFGNGVLVFLPPGAGNRLTRWGAQRMAAVIPVLDRCVRAFAPICVIAERRIYQPMIEGTKLGVARPLTTRTSLEEIFTAKVIEELPEQGSEVVIETELSD